MSIMVILVLYYLNSFSVRFRYIVNKLSFNLITLFVKKDFKCNIFFLLSITEKSGENSFNPLFPIFLIYSKVNKSHLLKSEMFPLKNVFSIIFRGKHLYSLHRSFFKELCIFTTSIKVTKYKLQISHYSCSSELTTSITQTFFGPVKHHIISKRTKVSSSVRILKVIFSLQRFSLSVSP